MNQRSLQNASPERHKEKKNSKPAIQSAVVPEMMADGGDSSLSLIKYAQLPEASKKRNVSAMVQCSCKRVEICQVGFFF